MIYEHRGELFPAYLKTGNAAKFIAPAALHFCRGHGVDVGGGRWPLEGANSIDLMDGGDAMALPHGPYDFVFSSHCLEHLADPVAALEHWKSKIRPTGVLFLYLPHPDMTYWRPTGNRKHLHEWQPAQMARMLGDLGFSDVMHSERDMYWSFAVVGFVPR